MGRLLSKKLCLQLWLKCDNINGKLCIGFLVCQISDVLRGSLGPLLMAPTVLVITVAAAVQLEIGVVTSSFCAKLSVWNWIRQENNISWSVFSSWKELTKVWVHLFRWRCGLKCLGIYWQVCGLWFWRIPVEPILHYRCIFYLVVRETTVDTSQEFQLGMSCISPCRSRWQPAVNGS